MGYLVRLVIGTAAASIMAGAAAQKPIVYPAKGQNAQQQTKDDGECYAWAKSNTGIDPVAVAQAPPPQQPASDGQVAKGALRGAAGGAIIADVAGGHAGTGAAAGAIVGGIRGARQRQQTQAAQQHQAQGQGQQLMSTFNRAYGACMEGRGYTVR
jgi:hypothetical protein